MNALNLAVDLLPFEITEPPKSRPLVEVTALFSIVHFFCLFSLTRLRKCGARHCKMLIMLLLTKELRLEEPLLPKMNRNTQMEPNDLYSFREFNLCRSSQRITSEQFHSIRGIST